MLSLIRPKILVLPLQQVSGAIHRAPISTSAIRLAGHGADEEVGPYPRTKEELDRAAKKYNLIPEDYKPLPEDQGFGDYPDLPEVGGYNRDWYEDFDDPDHLRNYGEPYQVMAERHYWEREDPLEHEKPGPPHWKKFPVYLSLFFLFPCLYWACERSGININRPWKQRFHHSPNQKYHQFPASSVSSSHH